MGVADESSWRLIFAGGEGGNDDDGEFMMYQVKESFNSTSVNHVGSEMTEQEKWKQSGNEAYKSKDWTSAIECYSKAIDAPVTQEQLLTEGPRRAILHSNRAAAYLARSKEGPSSSEANDDIAGHLGGCVQGELSREERAKLNCKAALMDCDQALDLESGNVKARYRKAQALKGLGKLGQARAVAGFALIVRSALLSDDSRPLSSFPDRVPFFVNVPPRSLQRPWR